MSNKIDTPNHKGNAGVEEGTIQEELRRATEDNPKNPDTKEPILLVKPKYFSEAIENGPGLSIFKAPYGRGKTSGVGYYTFHEGKRTGKYDTIYINLREVSEILVRNGIGLTGTADDLPLYVCAGAKGVKIEKPGIYMSSLSNNALNEMCKNVDNYVKTKNLRDFFEELAEKATKRLIIVMDEFENVGRFSKAGLEDTLLKLMNSLRPGALDDHPFKLNVVLAMQYLYYPPSLVQKLESGQPILGKMFSVNEDHTIPVEYSPEAYYDYIRMSLDYLRSKGYVSEERVKNIVGAIADSPKAMKALAELTSLPARIAFQRLRDLISKLVLYNGDDYADLIADYISNVISSSPVYKIYVAHKVPAELHDKITDALEYLAKKKWGESVSVDKVDRRGYEGVTVLGNGLYRIILFKQTEVKHTHSEKFKDTFSKVYGDFLSRWCSKPSSRKEEECKVIVLHPEDVRVSAIVQELRNLSYVTAGGGQKVKVSLTVDEIGLDDDEIASLVGAIENTTGEIAGDKMYFRARVEELKIKLP